MAVKRKIPIPIAWIVKRISENKRVRLKNAAVTEAIDISEMNRPQRHIDRVELRKIVPSAKDDLAIITSTIKITNSVFKKSVDISNALFEQSVDFSNSYFESDIDFVGSQFSEDANFKSSRFGRDARFSGSKFCGNAYFGNAKFFMNNLFNGSHFERVANFMESRFGGCSYFRKSTFKGDAWFNSSYFRGHVEFSYSNFEKIADFHGSRFIADFITFKDASISRPCDQEVICRKAKTLLEKVGDRDEADYHFYGEMEAKRKLKGITNTVVETIGDIVVDDEVIPTTTIDLLLSLCSAVRKGNLGKIKRFVFYNIGEYIFFQKFIGYGVHPYWIPIWWVAIAVLFGVFYKITQGISGANCWQQCVSYSFLVAFIRGWNETYQPKPGFELIVGIETFIGLIIFGVFLASITRKYMR